MAREIIRIQVVKESDIYVGRCWKEHKLVLKREFPIVYDYNYVASKFIYLAEKKLKELEQ